MKRVNGIYNVLAISMLLVMGLSSCLNHMDKKLKEEEQALIRAYIENNKITVEPTESGLYYLEATQGTGAFPVDGDSVGVLYKTKFINGYIIDQSVEGDPLKFRLGNQRVIEGLEEGVKLMQLNGKANLLIPSSLAYGPIGYWAIPGYTPLLMEVELVFILP